MYNIIINNDKGFFFQTWRPFFKPVSRDITNDDATG